MKNKNKGEYKRAEMKLATKQKKKQRQSRIHQALESDLDDDDEQPYPRIHRAMESVSDDDGDSSSYEDEIKFVGLVDKKTQPTSAPLCITDRLRRGGQKFEALLDSGASKA